MNSVKTVPEGRIIPFHPARNATLDTLRWAKKRHLIPILLEIDVTASRAAVRAERRRTGGGLSLTAWIVSCVARAAAEHPRVHALRKGRRKLVISDQVDVAVLVERSISSEAHPETLPMPVVVRIAERKTAAEIHEEIRRAQEVEVSPGSSSIDAIAPGWLQTAFFRLPSWARDLLFWRWLLRDPARVRRTMGTVVVTSVGMAAPGLLAWGIPLSLHALAIAIGGVATRVSSAGKSEMLALTVVFDHEVVDGAPVGRFIHRLQQLIRNGEGLGGGGAGQSGEVVTGRAAQEAPGSTV